MPRTIAQFTAGKIQMITPERHGGDPDFASYGNELHQHSRYLGAPSANDGSFTFPLTNGGYGGKGATTLIFLGRARYLLAVREPILTGNETVRDMDWGDRIRTTGFQKEAFRTLQEIHAGSPSAQEMAEVLDDLFDIIYPRPATLRGQIKAAKQALATTP